MTKRKRYPRSQREWQQAMARDLSIRLNRPAMILMRQLHGIWSRMESLDPASAEHQTAAGAYGKIFDRLRGMARRA